jgi:hypothetical protein
MSPLYACHVSSWLREFGRTFPGTAVSELGREHLDACMKSHKLLGTKSRNDRRNTVKMFRKWAVRKDYLPINHRLFEADGMAPESKAIIVQPMDWGETTHLKTKREAAWASLGKT